MEFSLDAGFDGVFGEFFVAQWFCPAPDPSGSLIPCPDPNTCVLDVQEFAPLRKTSR
jgi:hypothetical protein